MVFVWDRTELQFLHTPFRRLAPIGQVTKKAYGLPLRAFRFHGPCMPHQTLLETTPMTMEL